MLFFLFLFVNQIEKEDQDDPEEEVTKEEFQVNGWPPLLDPGLPDPRALGEVLRLRKWRLLIRQLPMLKPGSLPGGESGAPLCYAPVSGSQQHPWAPKLSAWLFRSHPQFFLPAPGCAQTARGLGSKWPNTGPGAVLQPLPFPVPGILSIRDLLLCHESSTWDPFPLCAIWFLFGLPDQLLC